jgi:hypothetical protein
VAVVEIVLYHFHFGFGGARAWRRRSRSPCLSPRARASAPKQTSNRCPRKYLSTKATGVCRHSASHGRQKKKVATLFVPENGIPLTERHLQFFRTFPFLHQAVSRISEHHTVEAELCPSCEAPDLYGFNPPASTSGQFGLFQALACYRQLKAFRIRGERNAPGSGCPSTRSPSRLDCPSRYACWRSPGRPPPLPRRLVQLPQSLRCQLLTRPHRGMNGVRIVLSPGGFPQKCLIPSLATRA